MSGLHPDERRHEEQMDRRRASGAKAAALRARLGVALRHRPGPLPRHEGKAFARIVQRSELTPWELVDELLGALLDLYPDASSLDAARWLNAPDRESGFRCGPHLENTQKARDFSESTRVDSAQLAIIGGSGIEATGIAPSPARNEGGSDR